MIRFEDGKQFAYDMIGEFHANGAWIHPRRIINTYELILVLEGTVHIREEDTVYALQPGDALLLTPGYEHAGVQEVNTPVAFYWFHFSTDLPVPQGQLGGQDLYELRLLLKRLLHITNTPGYSVSAADALGYLIYEQIVLSEKELPPAPVILRQITEYVRNNLKSGVTVGSIAAHLGYSPDHISRLFKKQTGTPLSVYIASRRMQLAKDMLLTTAQSVKQIAVSLGFAQENLFIKFFVYHEKISPTAFRARYYNTHINNT